MNNENEKQKKDKVTKLKRCVLNQDLPTFIMTYPKGQKYYFEIGKDIINPEKNHAYLFLDRNKAIPFFNFEMENFNKYFDILE